MAFPAVSHQRPMWQTITTPLPEKYYPGVKNKMLTSYFCVALKSFILRL